MSMKALAWNVSIGWTGGRVRNGVCAEHRAAPFFSALGATTDGRGICGAKRSQRFFFSTYTDRQTDTHTVENKRPPPERDERNETAEWQLAVAGRKREAVSATFFLSAHREAGARQCIVVDGHEDPHGAPAARRPAARAGVVVFADAGAGPATVAAASAAAAAAAGARRRNGPVT